MPTPKLKLISATFFQVDYQDLEKFVHEICDDLGYPHLKDYNFVATEECGNDSSNEFNPTDDPLDEYHLECLENNTWISNDTLFQLLCYKKYIPTGNYLVQVCW